jgi:pseudouridine kinase
MSDYRMNDETEAPILVIGASGVDFVGRIRKRIQTGTSNPAQIRTSWGGVARNVAENLALLGQPATLLTVIGEDEIGDQLLDHTAAAGVDTQFVLRSHQHPTGAYLAIVDGAGEMQFGLDDMRAARALSRTYLQSNQHLFEASAAVFVDANIPTKSLELAVQLSTRAGIPIYADPTSSTLAARLEPLLPRLNVITPNNAEAAVLSGLAFEAGDAEAGTKAAKILVSKGVDLAIITVAEFGVCYATSEISGHISAIRTEIVDPTGAGDALTAAVIFALLNGIPEDEAVRLGISAASLTLRHLGTVYPELSLEKLYDELII